MSPLGKKRACSAYLRFPGYGTSSQPASTQISDKPTLTLHPLHDIADQAATMWNSMQALVWADLTY